MFKFYTTTYTNKADVHALVAQDEYYVVEDKHSTLPFPQGLRAPSRAFKVASQVILIQ